MARDGEPVGLNSLVDEVLGTSRDDGIVAMPNYTISMYLDRDESVLRIYRDPVYDLEDWKAALYVAGQLGTGHAPYEYCDKDVSVFEYAVIVPERRQVGTITVPVTLAVAACIVVVALVVATALIA